MLHMMPQVIEEENSDEDNSSNASNKARKDSKRRLIEDKRVTISKQASFKLTEEKQNEARALGDKDKNSIPIEKRHKLDQAIEEEKVIRHKNSGSFHDIRDNYDFIRTHRSGSCKSAAAPLKFTKKRHLLNKITNSPLAAFSKKSHHFSTSTSKRKNMSSFVGISNLKSSELSKGDSVKRLQSNSRCLSDVSWNVTYLESDEKKSMPLARYDSNSSLLSGNSAHGGNTSTTTLTSKGNFNWDFRSLRNTSCKMSALDANLEEFPYGKRKNRMSRPFYKIVDTLPELIECEENLEEEYDLFSIRHNRINIMEDLNEFGRKSSKRHRSLDGRSKRKKAYNAPQPNNFHWDSDVSETEEEDWISDDSNKSKGKPISKISRIFNKIYADLFERPIRMKQIKERSRRNINTLGDDPINEDSNDSSNKSQNNERHSDASSSNISFRKRDVHTLFDGLDKPKKTLSCCNKFYEQIEDPILEEKGEYPKHSYDTKSEILKFKSRHDRGLIFDKILDKKDQMPNTNGLNIRSYSFDNEPILEENDEDMECVDTRFRLPSQFKLSK